MAIIISFAISVLLFLSNFHLCGTVGDICRGVMLGIFGSIGYLAPILLFVGTCFYMSNRGDMRAAVKITAVLIVLLALCGLAQLLLGDGYKEGQKIMEYYSRSGAGGSGGGLIGGGLVMLLHPSIGTIGSYLVLIVTLAIGIVCITEKSLVNLVKRGSGKAYQYAREDMDRRKVIHDERREEQRRDREEQMVRGVDLDATKLTYEPLLRGFVSGVPSGMHESILPEKEPLQESLPESLQEPIQESIPEPVPESLEKPTNPADIFRGNIALPSDCISTYKEHDSEEADDLYVSHDTRTLKEMSMVEDDEPIEESIADQFLGEVVDADDAIDAEGYYEIDPVDQEEAGINYDSFFIPEEPKTVVTASGKIIETDTEMVRKTMEKKREERKARPDDELTVPELIEKKAELPVVKKEYKFPPLDLLKKGTANTNGFSEKEYRETAIKLQQTLQNFGVGVTVTNISCGPSVTRYELHPEQGVKVSKIVALSDDIKLNLAASDIRIEAPIPGKSAVGIEVPNKENNTVFLRDLLESEEFKNHKSKVSFAVGKDIAGQTVVTDIAKMPHLLIAGATGSGKSVCINTLIMSIIYKATPEEVKLIMIDPKVVELSVYNGIPHLLIPVVTDPKKASGALNWAVAEMTDRYQKFAQYNVRDLKGYNEKVKNIENIEDENKPEKLPQIIIIVDELADLMMVAPGEVEDSICRLAQLARAAGIHLVIATQRPSVNVITGLIKANIPSRIAFSVSSGVDSRTIIDMNGAEKLLGKGDMLFYPAGVSKPQRVQGAFVADQEVTKIVDFLTDQGMTSDYNAEIENKITGASQMETPSAVSDRDAYFTQAGRFIIEKDKASIGMLQRMYKIGFNRAARIMDQLAEAGVVGDEEGTKPRKVLMSMEEFENRSEE
ncbi:MAG: DNA translocase FtsK [Clostridium sp.]